MKRVYIASPYTKGDVAVNVKVQLDTANELINAGICPCIPLLNHFLHMAHPRPDKDWYAIDNEWLSACDAILRLPGDSMGADAEIALARKLGIPVFFCMNSVIEYFRNER